MKKKPKKRKRGRPPAVEPLKQRKIRATDAQWERWNAAAEGNRLAYIRKVMDRDSKRKLSK